MRIFTLALCCLLFVFQCTAQELTVRTPEFRVQTTQALFLGKSAPIRDAKPRPMLDAKKEAWLKKQKMRPQNFPNRHASKVTMPERQHQGPDPLRQMGGGTGLVIEPIVNIDGLGDFGSPHDPTGEVGLDHYVQAVNVTDVGVYTKEGVLIEEFAMQTIWQGMGVQSAGDPIVLYDETAQRWLVTEFTDPANLLVAVSETSDPLGSYYAYSFSTPEFPDYPKYAIWPDAYVVTTNESGQGIHTQYFIDRDAMLAGATDVTIQQVEIDGTSGSEQGFIVTTPVDWDGVTLPITNPMVLSLEDSSWGGVDNDAIRMTTFDVDFNNPNNTTVTETYLETTPFDSNPCSAGGFGFACIPQLNGGGLDGIPETIMNVPKYRNFGTHESVVCCFVTDVTNGQNLAGIRWVEMRRPNGGAWGIYQEGTFSPDDNDRFMGSIAIDESGNIGLAYSVSSPNMYVGLAYTGRRSSDPLGQMTIEEYTIVEGEGPINSFGRYGDYAHMSVDPVNGNTFWFTSEYARSGGSGVGTRIVAFEIMSDTFDLAMNAITEPITSLDLSATELLTVEVRNAGLFPIGNFNLSFDLNGIFQESVLIADMLQPDQTFTHQFTVPMDMSANGSYVITATVSHPEDTAPSNNTLEVTIENLLANDAAVNGEFPANSCATEVQIPLTIFNAAGAPLTSGTIEVYSNGDLLQTTPWSGNLAYESSTIVQVNIAGLSIGTNAIEIVFTNPNGSSDEVPSNNSASGSVSVLLGGNIVVEILTDEYPEETTWELINASNQVIATGGPYSDESTLHTLEVCAPTDACYTFIIYDDYGDGICCQYGDGSYQVIDPLGQVVAEGGNFNDEESTYFCIDNCTLAMEVDVTNDGGSGTGTILINASNGVGYAYSIDGGSTWQAEPLFANLDAGVYNVVVQSNDGECQEIQTVTIQLVGIAEISTEVAVEVKPNPTDGFFQIELSGVPSGVHTMDYQVLDATGRLVFTRMMNRYDDTFQARVSLLAFADGVYYIRFMNEHVNELARVIKQTK
ncbi:MAG: hypothetical protein RLZZ262_615 [Bacteroidota bacterium]|jgi:hypothetical protein